MNEIIVQAAWLIVATFSAWLGLELACALGRWWQA